MGLTLNTDKCQFSVNCVTLITQEIIDFSVNLILSVHIIYYNSNKVVAIEQVPEPQTVKDVQRFLGMMSQMSKFIPKLVDHTQPLRDLLLKGRHWTWEYPQQQHLIKVKRILSTVQVLALCNLNA